MCTLSINCGRTKIELSDKLLCNFIGHRPHHRLSPWVGGRVSGYILFIIGKMSSFDMIIGHNCGRTKTGTSSYDPHLIITKSSPVSQLEHFMGKVLHLWAKRQGRALITFFPESELVSFRFIWRPYYGRILPRLVPSFSGAGCSL